ncbi:galanin receptor type 1 [Nematostella vectensis]|uniref:galanin receptor type 1 n=1 Tax=Nematostella vectensis TaxID=45351 RepID=UPI0020770AF0|nr:galanin receptor type 1 [Nematostella vectensis]
MNTNRSLGLRTNFSRDNLNRTEGMESMESGVLHTVKIIIYAIILLLSVVGNTMVVIVICRQKRMLTPSNILVLNLAVCDILTPLTSIPFDLAYEENGYVWPYGAALCKALWPTATLSATSASLTLTVLSLDRYRVIMHPFQERLTRTQIKILILFSHSLSLALVIPYARVLELDPALNDCMENWSDFSQRQAYTMVLFLVQYGLPLPFMIIMYTLALKNLYSTTDKAMGMVNLLTERKNAGFTDVFLVRQNVRRDNMQNLKATKMFVTVVSVFAVCMLPNQVLWLWSDYGRGYEHESFNTAAIVCRFFTYANSVCNALIYSFYSKEFRRGYRKIFRAFNLRVLGRTISLKRRPSNQQALYKIPRFEITRTSVRSRETRAMSLFTTNTTMSQGSPDSGIETVESFASKSCDLGDTPQRKESPSQRKQSQQFLQIPTKRTLSHGSNKFSERRAVATAQVTLSSTVEGLLVALRRPMNGQAPCCQETIREFIENLRETRL